MTERGRRGRDGPGREVLPSAEVDRQLVDRLNDAVVVADERGRIVYANPATTSLLGWTTGELRGAPLTTIIPERLRALHESAFEQFVATGVPQRAGRPLRVPAYRADGTEVPIELLIGGLVERPDGRVVAATLRDARDRVDIERHREVADQLLDILARGRSVAEAVPRVLEAIGQALGWDAAALWSVEPDFSLLCRHVWTAGGAGFEHFVAASASAMLEPGSGLPGRVLVTSTAEWIGDITGDPQFPRLRHALADGLHAALAAPVFADDEPVGVVELLSREKRPPAIGMVDAMTTIGERLGPFLVRLRDEEQRERLLVEVEMARRAQEFVLDASRALAEAHDYRQTLERLAAIAVPTLGDLCLIDVLDESGALRRMAAHHADPARRAEVAELELHYPPDPGGTHPVLEVVRSGRSSWAASMTEDFLRRTTRDERHYRFLSSLGFVSYMCVPLVVGAKVRGAVTLMSAGSGRRFAESDLALAERLASQVAAVVEGARVRDLDHRIAHTLQRSLLPDRLVVPDGFRVAARYLPAAEGVEIGGDWYDVFVLPDADGRLATVVGDVEGHDMVAASVMGQLRNVLRAFVLDGAGPASALERLSRFSTSSGIERMATVALAEIDPRSGRFVIASAGHHPPVLVAPPGRGALVTVRPGPPVGVAGRYAERSGELAEGASIVLYTDGLVESRSTSVEDGVAAILRALDGRRGPEEICAALEALIAARGDNEDDVAILAVERSADRSTQGPVRVESRGSGSATGPSGSRGRAPRRRPAPDPAPG